ncbi:MAG: hypothetical protein K0R12_67 [Gammaproteobacteria bacterium]|jgi:hypothetical protein|nr:hypothetical protein [Gammaproteobacteria bacterium]
MQNVIGSPSNIKHREGGCVVRGFSQEPNFEEGFPDQDEWYWIHYQFTDTHSPAIRQWMEEKDCNYLRRIQHENPVLFQMEFTELKAKNPAHPAINQLALETKPEDQHLVEEVTSLAMPASSTSLATSSSPFPELAPAATHSLQGNGYVFGTSYTLFAAAEIEIIPEAFPTSSVASSSASDSDHVRCCCVLS